MSMKFGRPNLFGANLGNFVSQSCTGFLLFDRAKTYSGPRTGRI